MNLSLIVLEGNRDGVEYAMNLVFGHRDSGESAIAITGGAESHIIPPNVRYTESFVKCNSEAKRKKHGAVEVRRAGSYVNAGFENWSADIIIAVENEGERKTFYDEPKG